jgi:capsular exopolysaccharide synthesis family protein
MYDIKPTTFGRVDTLVDRASNFVPRVDDGAYSPNQVDRRVVTLTAPASIAAEQYRTLYYRIERMRELRPLKVVAFTSALPGEGKTVTAVNLALTSARANPERRILLVDGDLRCSQVASTLGIGGRPGLADLLGGVCDPGEAVRRFKATQLAVVPAGKGPEDPTPLLGSLRMKRFLESMRSSFDEVYLDLPPALPFADAGILGCQADGVVLVIRESVTSHQRVTQAIDQLAGAPVVGCVLNGADQSSAPYHAAYVK